jgi:predicted O-methyltransferase YrrM
VLQQIKTNWNRFTDSPMQAAGFIFRRAIPFGIRFKDLEAYRISRWSYGQLPRVYLPEFLLGIENVDVVLLNLFQRRIGLSLDAQELMLLCAIQRFIGAANVLEIGTYDGNTALNLAANLNADGCVTTIDLPPDWDGQFTYDVPETLRNVTDRNRIGIQYRHTPQEKCIKQVLGDSAAIDWQRLTGPFDLIFIDGCHYYEYVKKDTENALRYLREGGVIVWHDYGEYKDVSRAVDETARHITVHAIRGTRLAIGWTGQSPQHNGASNGIQVPKNGSGSRSRALRRRRAKT